MKSFLKYILAIFLVVIIACSSMETRVEIKKNSILHIQLTSEVLDRAPNSPFGNFDPFTFTTRHTIGLNNILKSIKKAKDDDNIKGILFEPAIIKAGMATKEEIRDALLDFKESGKFVISYSNYYAQSSYYIASAADSLYINPAGIVEFIGLKAEIMYYKKAFEKWGIEPQIFRYGKFKSAVEPFMEEKMSEENRLQIESWLNSLWKHYLSGISDARNIDIATLNYLADSLKIRHASDALNYQLVDGIKYKDELLNELKDITNARSIEKINFISLSDYIKAHQTRFPKNIQKNKIALIYAYGPVVIGENDEGFIASTTISREIRKARLDSSIKAIVFRVNSGGGLVIAAEIVWRELMLAKETKPVVASMGDYAASGGYYVLACADTIVANPNTITGSIGVFGVLFNVSRFLEDKIGITYDYVQTNAHSNMESALKLLDEKEKKYIQASVNAYYEDFVEKVSDGRNMKPEEVDSIGQGRVWTGEEAQKNGLIDVLGGLVDAIEIAADMANLEKYTVIELPEQKDPFEQFLQQLTGEAKMEIVKKELGDDYLYYKVLKEVQTYQGIQARLPYHIDIY